MPKRYFAAQHDGKTFFRASASRVYRSLAYVHASNWGMSSLPGAIPVREIDAAEYKALVKRKAARITAAIAIKGYLGRGYGSEPTASWVTAETVEAEPATTTH